MAALAACRHTPCLAARPQRRRGDLAAPRYATAAAVTLAPPLPHPGHQSGGLQAAQPAPALSGWAVVRIGQTKEWIEVGRALAVPSSALRDPSQGEVVQFTEVLACKAGSSLLLRGTARCKGVVVEGVVEDEFPAPSTMRGASPVPLSKVLVTAIRVPEEGLGAGASG